jgi:hypothetical protein
MFNELFQLTLAEARKQSKMVNDAFELAMSERYDNQVRSTMIFNHVLRGNEEYCLNCNA